MGYTRVLFSDGSSATGNRRDETYELKPHDKVYVLPSNPQKKKHRGRYGILTGGHNHNLKARVEFTDSEGSYGYIDARDLISFSQRPSN